MPPKATAGILTEFEEQFKALGLDTTGTEEEPIERLLLSIEGEMKTLSREFQNEVQWYSSLQDEDYKLQRNRFISAFKRDKLNRGTDLDMEIIGEANSWANGGDVMVDAQLYQGVHGRRDYYEFEQLYGYLPETVLKLTHMETIAILNGHATIVAAKNKHCSEKFHQQFALFVELFKKSNFDESYLQGNWTAVTHAYQSFIQCCFEEVTPVEIVD